MEMESDDDLEQFSLTKEASSHVPQRKLKRLKKATTATDYPSSKLETLDFEKSKGEDLEEPNMGSEPRSGGFDEENELSSGFEGLGVEEDGFGVRRPLEFDSVAEELDGKDGDPVEDMDMGEIIRDLRKEESEKKRRVSDGIEENKEEKKEKKKKKKGVESVGFDELPISSDSMKMTKRERTERLNQLRSESQRLLRETRDAAFKPVPVVHKPISSILEKIRRRKLEVSRKFVTMRETYISDDNDGFSREVKVDVDSQNVTVEERGNDMVVNMASEEVIVSLSSSGTSCADGSSNLENHSSQETENHISHEASPSQAAINVESKQAFRAPIDDTQDLISDSQTNDSKDELQEETPSSPLEEVLAPSLLTMNLKLDSAPHHDVSSDEEDNEKENTDLHPHSSSPNGDPVKAFVDDEAEEEDDSDNDLLRFQENEEEDYEEDEELKDLIATAYEEKQIDTERRNELHHKWLEQQDAAGTENLLQRLKCGLQQRESTLLEEEENEEDQEDNMESDDEAAEDSLPTNAVRMNMRKIKEMIPKMFTDKDDVYISSDDEEMEKKLVKQCLFEKAEEQAKLLSPAKDESSKELFCRIKKVNNVDNQRKAKTSSISDKLLLGRSRNVSSKSSFLGRGSNHSLPPSKKHGSSMVRSFIFERDDSSSRTSISVAEDSSEAIQQENRPIKASAAKFSNSQVKSSSQNTKAAAETSSRSSLYEILKRSSLRSSHRTRDSTAGPGHTESIFAAFKLEKKPIKRESIKTL